MKFKSAVIITRYSMSIGCATKYVARWRDKDGIKDLRKSIHYLSKANDRNISGISIYQFEPVTKFCEQLNQVDSEIIMVICKGMYDSAIKNIEELINSYGCEPTANYIDPDHNYIKG